MENRQFLSYSEIPEGDESELVRLSRRKGKYGGTIYKKEERIGGEEMRKI